MASWQNYVDSLRGQGEELFSGDLDTETLASLNPEQQQQLERLKEEATKLGDDLKLNVKDNYNQ
jgi:hypothetical protein